MKLSSIINLSSDSVVNGGASIPNVYTTKDQHKKKKTIKLGATPFGGINTGSPTSCSVGDSSGAADGGDGGSAGGDGG